MAVNNIQITQGTQTSILTDNTGGAGGTLIGVVKISTDAQGTFNGPWNGAVTISAGTINAATVTGNVGISSGTINVSTISTLPNLPGGSIAITAGTINAGTVNLGTIVGKDANAAAQTGNPLGVGGTDSGGTIRTWGVDSSGIGRVKFDTGTISVLPNLPQGSITVTAGTISAGTINTGTINSGTINLGTIVGKDANASAQTGNPLAVGGTDSGGTIRTWGVDANGIGRVKLDTGTISVLPNLPQGSINVTAGTIATLGTMGTLGLVNTVTTVSNITNGSIVVTAGTNRLDARTTQNIVSYGTQVAFTGAAAATIIGSASVGAGTSLWVNDVSLFNTQSAAGTFILGFGTAQQGTNVLLRAPLGTSTSPGIEKPYPRAVNAGMTNQDLVLSATGAGTVDLSISYLISA